MPDNETRIGLLQPGEKAIDFLGNYLYLSLDGLYLDELGYKITTVDFNCRCKILESWPVLQDGQVFQLIDYRQSFPLALIPYHVLTFRLDNGFRFCVEMSNYACKIRFELQTIDPRVPRVKSLLHYKNGRKLLELLSQPLKIVWTQDMQEPVLQVIP